MTTHCAQAARLRAAQIGAIWNEPLNTSRRLAGLVPLSLAEAEAIFSDARPQLPLSSAPPAAGSFGGRRAARREAANELAAAQRLRTDRAGIDALYGELAAKLNSGLPSARPTGVGGGSAPRSGDAFQPAARGPTSQGQIDDMYATFARSMNATLEPRQVVLSA
jgi:hypothetical protein